MVATKVGVLGAMCANARVSFFVRGENMYCL